MQDQPIGIMASDGNIKSKHNAKFIGYHRYIYYITMAIRSHIISFSIQSCLVQSIVIHIEINVEIALFL